MDEASLEAFSRAQALLARNEHLDDDEAAPQLSCALVGGNGAMPSSAVPPRGRGARPKSKTVINVPPPSAGARPRNVGPAPKGPLPTLEQLSTQDVLPQKAAVSKPRAGRRAVAPEASRAAVVSALDAAMPSLSAEEARLVARARALLDHADDVAPPSTGSSPHSRGGTAHGAKSPKFVADRKHPPLARRRLGGRPTSSFVDGGGSPGSRLNTGASQARSSGLRSAPPGGCSANGSLGTAAAAAGEPGELGGEAGGDGGDGEGGGGGASTVAGVIDGLDFGGGGASETASDWADEGGLPSDRPVLGGGHLSPVVAGGSSSIFGGGYGMGSYGAAGDVLQAQAAQRVRQVKKAEELRKEGERLEAAARRAAGAAEQEKVESFRDDVRRRAAARRRQEAATRLREEEAEEEEREMRRERQEEQARQQAALRREISQGIAQRKANERRAEAQREATAAAEAAEAKARSAAEGAELQKVALQRVRERRRRTAEEQAAAEVREELQFISEHPVPKREGVERARQQRSVAAERLRSRRVKAEAGSASEGFVGGERSSAEGERASRAGGSGVSSRAASGSGHRASGDLSFGGGASSHAAANEWDRNARAAASKAGGGGGGGGAAERGHHSQVSDAWGGADMLTVEAPDDGETDPWGVGAAGFGGGFGGGAYDDDDDGGFNFGNSNFASVKYVVKEDAPKGRRRAEAGGAQQQQQQPRQGGRGAGAGAAAKGGGGRGRHAGRGGGDANGPTPTQQAAADSAAAGWGGPGGMSLVESTADFVKPLRRATQQVSPTRAAYNPVEPAQILRVGSYDGGVGSLDSLAGGSPIRPPAQHHHQHEGRAQGGGGGGGASGWGADVSIGSGHTLQRQGAPMQPVGEDREDVDASPPKPKPRRKKEPAWRRAPVPLDRAL